MKASSRGALLIALAMAAGSRPAFAERWDCHPIRSRDTAALLARRLAGNADYRYRSGFQIFDPATSKFVAKARYNNIRPGWLVCVSKVSGGPAVMTAPTVATFQIPAASTGIGPALLNIRLDPAWYAVLLLPAASFAWYVYVAARHRKAGRGAIAADMILFGETFIREFERPLVQPSDPAPAIRSGMRCKPRRGRMEVFLAPAAGRRYPNLSDHKKNVEYDLARVLDLLGDRPFISQALRQQGEWVVVPFQVKVGEKQAGVT